LKNPTIGELAPGAIVKLMGDETPYLIVKKGWAVDLSAEPPQMHQFSLDTPSTHLADPLSLPGEGLSLEALVIAQTKKRSPLLLEKAIVT